MSFVDLSHFPLCLDYLVKSAPQLEAAKEWQSPCRTARGCQGLTESAPHFPANVRRRPIPADRRRPPRTTADPRRPIAADRQPIAGFVAYRIFSIPKVPIFSMLDF